jgi:tetratricopeptide (TPR) repeat protein
MLDTSSAHEHVYSTGHLWIQERYAEVERSDRARLALNVPYSERIDLLWDLMLCLAQQGRFQETLETTNALRREVAAAGHPEGANHPNAITMALAEAQALRQTGQLRESVARFEALSRYDPPASTPSLRASARMWIYAHLASTLNEVGDTSALARLAERMDSVKELSGALRDLKYARYAAGLVEASRGKDAAAYELFREASFVTIDGFGPAVLERARAAMRLGRPREAVTLLQRMMYTTFHWYLTHTELHETLAQAWLAAGNRDSARAHLQAVDRAWQNADPPVKAKLAALHQRLGLD